MTASLPPGVRRRSLLAAGLAGAAAGSLPGCASPTRDAPAAVLAPNANLFAQGIPPVPLALVAKVERYTEFRGHEFVDWHPMRARDAGGAPPGRRQHRAAVPRARRRWPSPSRSPTSPTRSPRRAASRARAATSSSRAAAAATRPTSSTGSTSTAAPSRCSPTPTSATTCSAGCTAAAAAHRSSVPLDRTAQGGTRAARSATTLWLVDPLQARRPRASWPNCPAAAGSAARSRPTTGGSRSRATSRPPSRRSG